MKGPMVCRFLADGGSGSTTIGTFLQQVGHDPLKVTAIVGGVALDPTDTVRHGTKVAFRPKGAINA